MITQDFYSCKWRYTIEGVSVELSFTCTATDAANWTDGINRMPYIGESLDHWSPDRSWTNMATRQDLAKKMFCTDIIGERLDNTNMKIACLFSTIAPSPTDDVMHIEDTTTSIQESFDVSSFDNVYSNIAIEDEDTGTTTDYCYVDVWSSSSSPWPENSTPVKARKNWADIYKDYTGDTTTTDGAIPNLIIKNSEVILRISLYSSRFCPEKALTNINTVNGYTGFLLKYANWAIGPNYQTVTDLPWNKPFMNSFDDEGCWLLTGCPITRVRPACWRYDFTFAYNKNGWNYQNGVNFGSSMDRKYLYLYPPRDWFGDNIEDPNGSRSAEIILGSKSNLNILPPTVNPGRQMPNFAPGGENNDKRA